MKILVSVVVVFISVLAGIGRSYAQTFSDGNSHNIYGPLTQSIEVLSGPPNYTQPTTVNVYGKLGNPYSINARVYTGSCINIWGGSFQDITADYGGIVNMYGGTARYILAYSDFAEGLDEDGNYFKLGDHCEVTVSGGSVGCIVGVCHSVITWSGGLIDDSGTQGIYLYDNCKLTIIGSEFLCEEPPPGFTGITNIFCRLADGGWRSTRLWIDSPEASVRFINIPEPSSLIALGGGIAGLTTFYRRRKI